jgi:hypothetical protein
MVFFDFLWCSLLLIVFPLRSTHHHTARSVIALTVHRLSQPRSLHLGRHLADCRVRRHLIFLPSTIKPRVTIWGYRCNCEHDYVVKERMKSLFTIELLFASAETKHNLFSFSHGVRLSPLGTGATVCLIVAAPDDR